MSQVQARRRWQAVDGILLLDKSGGMTSNLALQKARRLFNAAKAGHTGTLDPMATGLLPVLFGEATKFSHLLLDADKVYDAVILLGETTTTGDAEGELVEKRDVNVAPAQVHAACVGFLGEIEQLPPMYSALKHQGKALYEYARAGVEIARTPRRVTIHTLTVTDVALPRVSVRVCCSKGTYIRTLAEDIGAVLGCGAHLVALRRVATGPLRIDAAATLDELALLDEAARAERLMPVDTLLAHLPRVDLAPDDARRFANGNPVALDFAAGEARVYGECFIGLGRCTGEAVQPVRLVAQMQSS